ncbi:MAG TPA: hypothetical protein VK791_03010 [bacterium]|jgi:hypothetical protein|nr:hypothetical protein [bacterium]
MRSIFKNHWIYFLGLALFLNVSTKAFAQFETDTPTLSATPTAFMTGTPEISTVWLEFNPPDSSPKKKALKPTPTPNISVISSLTEPEDIAPVLAPTPQTASEVGTNQSKTAALDKIGNGSRVSGTNGSILGQTPSKIASGKSSSEMDLGSGDENGSQELSSSDSSSKKSGSSTFGETSGIKSGSLGMIDLYETGIKNYKNKDYDSSIECLKKALTIRDNNVPFYYYAETNAMLAVIYKFYRIDENLSRQYCEAALKIDPSTKTARKLIHEIGASNTEAEKKYLVGIKAYEKGNDSAAIGAFKAMVEDKDSATPSFYYAEAYKILGLIYQFHLKDENQAVFNYRAALKIEPDDETAKKNLSQLR